jgi:DNA-binding NarL/FixJ family response regulator
MRPQVEYVRALDGTRIAMARYPGGTGVPIVCMRPPQFSHLEHEWVAGSSHHEFENLISERTVVRFDPRGTGLSDRNVRNQSIEARVLDLEAVVAAAALQRFAIDGISSSGLPAIVYASRHPERVVALVLQNAFIRGSEWWGMAPRRALMALAPIDWQLATENWAWLTFAAATSERILRLAEHIRACVDPVDMLRMAEAEATAIISREMAALRIRTLVLNHEHFSRMVPPGMVREVARTVKGSRLMTINSLQDRVDAIASLMREVDAERAMDEDMLPRPVFSQREEEVLALLAMGFTNREIAGQLVLSRRTVDSHVGAILRKTGCRSRIQAARYAREA